LNFLAHFHLAWPDEGLVAGGLEGDYCKGPLRGELPDDIERGVRLHRAVDAYTDGHPLIAQLRRDLPGDLRRYAGILIDLSFDHFLSKHWERYCDIPLAQFNAGVYRSLRNREHALSCGSRRMLARLVERKIDEMLPMVDTLWVTDASDSAPWASGGSSAARDRHMRSRSCCFLASNSACVSAPDWRSWSSLAIWSGMDSSAAAGAGAARLTRSNLRFSLASICL